MNSKQTDKNEQEKTMSEDWSPASSFGEAAKSVKPSNENVEAEFQKMFADGGIGGTIPNHKVSRKRASSIDTDDSIESDDSKNTADSLHTESTVEIGSTPKRISSRQRKESLEEYRQTFLSVPKLEDRKPVFISREVRDSLDEIVRKLGGRRMSVSGFIENLARHHLDIYQDDLEMWKKI